MRILVCICVLSAGLAAQDSGKTTSPPQAPPVAKQAKKAPQVTDIPKGAVETAPGSYRWTDKDGKVWTYRRTSFGVSRRPADPADTRQNAAYVKNSVSEGITAVEDGDSVRFERATPFGTHKWIRKKTELNETERKAWEMQKQNSTVNRSAEKE